MGKKKIAEKVRLFYRGPLREPTKIANESEAATIVDALKETSVTDSKKNDAFKTCWGGKETTLKILFGLKSALRCLKRKQTRGLIYDDTASIHLTKILNEFAYRSCIPIIQVHRLPELVGKQKIKSLLVVSVVDATVTEEEEREIYKSKDPKPKPIDKILVSDKVDNLFKLLQASIKKENNLTFKPPVLDKVLSSGKNRSKKEAKKSFKLTKKTEKQAKIVKESADIGAHVVLSSAERT